MGGKRVAGNGVSEFHGEAMALPQDLLCSLRVGLPISHAVFKIAAPQANPKVRVMELVNQTITAQRIVEFNAANGFVEASLYDDILKVAMFDRHGQIAASCLRFSQWIRRKSRRRRSDDQPG